MKRLCRHCRTWYLDNCPEHTGEPECMTCLMRQHAHNVISFRAQGITLATNLTEEGLLALEADYQANAHLYR